MFSSMFSSVLFSLSWRSDDDGDRGGGHVQQVCISNMYVQVKMVHFTCIEDRLCTYIHDVHTQRNFFESYFFIFTEVRLSSIKSSRSRSTYMYVDLISNTILYLVSLQSLIELKQGSYLLVLHAYLKT